MRLIAQTVTGLMTSESSTTTDNLSYGDIDHAQPYGELEIDDEVFTEARRTGSRGRALLPRTPTTRPRSVTRTGIAGDAIQTLTELMASDGDAASQSNSPSSKVDVPGDWSSTAGCHRLRALPGPVHGDGAEGRSAEQHLGVPEDGPRESPVLQQKNNPEISAGAGGYRLPV